MINKLPNEEGNEVRKKINEIIDTVNSRPYFPRNLSQVEVVDKQKPLPPPNWSNKPKDPDIAVGTVKPYTSTDGTVSTKMELVFDGHGWQTRLITSSNTGDELGEGTNSESDI